MTDLTVSSFEFFLDYYYDFEILELCFLLYFVRFEGGSRLSSRRGLFGGLGEFERGIGDPVIYYRIGVSLTSGGGREFDLEIGYRR